MIDAHDQFCKRSGLMSLSRPAGYEAAAVRTIPRVLLSEGIPENREMLSRRLRRHGFDLIAARADAKGIEIAQLESPDLILLELNILTQVENTLRDTPPSRGETR